MKWEGILDVLAAADPRSVNAFKRYMRMTGPHTWPLRLLHQDVVNQDLRSPSHFEVTL